MCTSTVLGSIGGNSFGRAFGKAMLLNIWTTLFICTICHKSGLPNFFVVVSWAVFVDMAICHVWYTTIFPETFVFTVAHRSVNMILLNFLIYIL